MIDLLFPLGVPDGFVQLGRFWFVGCSGCGQPVAVAFSSAEEVPRLRLRAFIDLAAALSGALLPEDPGWQKVAGVVVRPNYRDCERAWVHPVYPAQQPLEAVRAEEVVEWIRTVGILTTGHQCGPLSRPA
jgi:hypothetical protein